MLKTSFTELVGIRHPIVLGGMQWVGRAELVAAVSNAGGLGILSALTHATPEGLRQEIRLCRELTPHPFGVNITLLPSTVSRPYEAYLQVAMDEGVCVLETAGNSPRAFVKPFKDSGGVVIHKCTSVRHALSAEREGVDVVSLDGFECSGHPGEDDVGGLALLPVAAQRLKIPFIASGGIATGRGLAAAISLGAAGVNMGTRFCVTAEAALHPAIKQALVEATERDTVLIMRSLRNTGRVLRTPVSSQVLSIEQQGGARFEDIRELVAGHRGRDALVSGDLEGGLIWASQAVGLIEDVPTCRDLVARMVSECEATLRSAVAMLTADAPEPWAGGDSYYGVPLRGAEALAAVQ